MRYLILLLLLSGCAIEKKIDALQTQIHDHQNQVNEFMEENKAHDNFRRDCVTQELSFGTDSFGFYKKCPNESKALKKEIIKDAYNLTKP